ncbi:MAG: DUF1579 family protein [Planctomycetota bacterium]
MKATANESPRNDGVLPNGARNTTTQRRDTVRNGSFMLGAGALGGAALAILLGAAFAQAPAANRPAGRVKPSPEQITQETRAAMEVLNQFVGRWDINGQSFDENDKPVGTFTGSAHYTFVMANNFLMGETTLTAGNYLLDQTDYFGYSPGLNKYTHVLLTELDKSMIYQQGEWMAEVGSFVFAVAAPLDSPKGTPRSVGLEYGFSNAGIAVTMSMQNGVKPMRKVRMLLTKSTQPAAPTGADGMPAGGNVQYQQGDPAKMRAQMQQAVGQMTAQKQAMQQYIQGMNMGMDSQMDKMMDQQMDQGVTDQTRELLRGPE